MADVINLNTNTNAEYADVVKECSALLDDFITNTAQPLLDSLATNYSGAGAETAHSAWSNMKADLTSDQDAMTREANSVTSGNSTVITGLNDISKNYGS